MTYVVEKMPEHCIVSCIVVVVLLGELIVITM